MEGTRQMIPIDRIRLDAAEEVRARFKPETVEHYTADLAAGEVFPPITTFYERAADVYWASDGRYRTKSHLQAGRTEIEAIVRLGTYRDALWEALGSNTRHGEARDPEDTEKAVTKMLTDAEWSRLPLREVARRCRTSPRTVGRIRDALRQEGVLSVATPQMEVEVRRKGKNGEQVYPMRPHRPAAEPSPPPAAEKTAAAPPPVPKCLRNKFKTVLVPWWRPYMSSPACRQLPLLELAARVCTLWVWAIPKDVDGVITYAKGKGFDYANQMTLFLDPRMGLTVHCVIAVQGWSGSNLPGYGFWEEGVSHPRELTDFYALVEQHCPGPRVEVLATRPREGWACLPSDGEGGLSWTEIPLAG